MTTDQKRILELENENKQLKAEIVTLTTLVQKLLQEVDNLKHPKNSRNSSVPPSKDGNRPFKTKSLRTPDGKKVGGKIGYEGTTLKYVRVPDFIIKHKPTYFNNCGTDVSNNPTELIAQRQVVDIPH